MFLAGMFLSAAIIGAAVLALVLRFGQRAEVAAWAFSYLMLLLCGLYYPISVFPAAIRVVAQFIPLTYFLDYFRHFYGFPLVSRHPLLYGFSESVIYLLISYGIVYLTLKSAYKRGTLLRLSEVGQGSGIRDQGPGISNWSQRIIRNCVHSWNRHTISAASDRRFAYAH